ncbi:class I SAM-dependent methyltransferase [uncultured Devosia sp.]|uniref:class I SAM-dependent methyltransferase n=1 Tax=uncultured Devosia sp. TaxID=211434 RepID=UPI0035CC4E77
MSVHQLQVHPAKPALPMSDVQLDWLMQAILGNRFLPEPDPRSVFVGDGDYRAIGVEYLSHLVRLGGLLPQHRVLDIGSGIGRLAMPLTQYLAPGASYLGVDPAREGVAWSQQHITGTYPNFRFRHLDIAHEIYNPEGLLRGASLVLPLGDRSVDFAFMVSVVTHLPPDEVAVYAREVARVLAPGGRFLVTSFIMDETGTGPQPKDPRCSFVRTQNGPDWYVDPAARFGAVAFDDGWLDRCLAEAGLVVQLRSLGHWRGTKASHYQDIIVATKPGGTH